MGVLKHIKPAGVLQPFLWQYIIVYWWLMMIALGYHLKLILFFYAAWNITVADDTCTEILWGYTLFADQFFVLCFFIPKVFCIHINIYFFTVETSYAILPCMYMQPLLQSGLSLIRILIDVGNRQLNSRREAPSTIGGPHFQEFLA